MSRDEEADDGTRLMADDGELEGYRELVRLLRRSPVPDEEVLAHLPLFLTRSSLGHVLWMDALYRRILPVHGSVFELGVRWGRNLSLLTQLRSLYEPYNLSRRVVGFDTFAGFPHVAEKDGGAAVARPGALDVPDGYEQELSRLLAAQERLAPRSQIRKFELVKGDAAVTLPEYLKRRPETLCALAYFDFDLYEPTRQCLEALRPHLVRGSVLAFDQLTLRTFPGETLAFQEVLGSLAHRVERDGRVPFGACVVIE